MASASTGHRLRLKRLQIRDFRGIDALDLDFTDADGDPLDLIVIAGGNGRGKTSVLEAILLALGNRELLPDDAAPLIEQIRFGASVFEVQAVVQSSGGGVTQDFVVGQHQSFELPQRSDVQVGGMSKRSPKLSPGHATGVGEWRWGGAGPIEHRVDYFSARREPELLGQTSDNRGARSMTEARRLVELKRRLVSAYYRGLRNPRPAGERSDVFSRLQGFWSAFQGVGEILDVIPVSNDPGSGDEVILRDPGPIPDDVTSLAHARRFAATRLDIPRMVPLERLSSGQVSLLAFAGPLVFRDVTPDIVLIDEPEQHLHVQWQQRIMPALRELLPETQWIVATHSEEILQSALSYEQFVLVEDSDPRARAAEPPAEQGEAGHP